MARKTRRVKIYTRCWKAEDYHKVVAEAKTDENLGAWFVLGGVDTRFLTIPDIGLVYTAKFYEAEVAAADAIAARLGIEDHLADYLAERERRAPATTLDPFAPF